MSVSNYLNILAWSYKFQSQNLYLSRSELLFKIKSRRLLVPYQKVFNFSNIVFRFRDSSDIFIYLNIRRSFLSVEDVSNFGLQLVPAHFLRKFFFAKNALPLSTEDVYLSSNSIENRKDYLLFGVYNHNTNFLFDPLFYQICKQFYATLEFSNLNFFFFHVFKYIFRPFDTFLPLSFNLFSIISSDRK